MHNTLSLRKNFRYIIKYCIERKTHYLIHNNIVYCNLRFNIFKTILSRIFWCEQTDVMYMTIWVSKILRKVDHRLLVLKLNKIGFDNPLLSWHCSFLAHKTQYVKFKNYISKPINATFDVQLYFHTFIIFV